MRRIGGAGLFALGVLALSCASQPTPATPQAAASKASVEPAPGPAQEESPPQQSEEPALGQRGWLGVELATAPGEPGVRVRRVLRNSPAARAGLLAGDLILRIDGQAVTEPADVVRRVGTRGAGARLSVALKRGSTDRMLAVVLDARPDDDGMMKMSFVGAKAPPFDSLQTVQGSVGSDVTALRGKVVVLEFWASWCAVCRILVPTINDWYARYSAQGVEVIGVTTDSVALASRTAYELRMKYPIASDDSGNTSEAYGAMALPTLFVLDKQGVVRDVMVGYSRARLTELEALIEKLVAES
jgi:peroxiredoxin